MLYKSYNMSSISYSMVLKINNKFKGGRNDKE